MPDPMDELEHFTTPGLTMDALPAAEVRRRGTRLRRRNHALAAIGGVAAVAIIATPLAMAAGNGRTDSTPPPATQSPSPSVAWVREIPADFPLADGLPGTTRSGFVRSDADACPGLGWSPDGPPATVAVSQVVQKETEGDWTRTLAVYADEESATRSRLDLAARVAQCAATTDGRSRSTEDVARDAGSLVYVDHVSEAGDAFVHRVVQVGNALLLDTTYSMGTGDPAVVEQAADLLETKSAPVVDAMCVFSADPC
ncbi:hypothetical protein [Nocardioides sp. URHA0020]|uniref:hypothetical protein n=1 Tax=Nocardioides sp. URHA0020 TaxID=1380392 RepID=UPI000AEE7617|nr:hypothetical protein [Nocardioides sp. URHA0020]